MPAPAQSIELQVAPTAPPRFAAAVTSALVYLAAVSAILALTALIPSVQHFTAALPWLAALPVIAAAWRFGRRGGVAMALAMPPLALALLGPASVTNWRAIIGGEGLTDLAVLLTVGVAVGWMRELLMRVGESEAARAHLAAIVVSSGDAIFSQDRAGRILSWNPGAARLYGYAAAEIVGREAALLTPPAHAAALTAALGRVAAGTSAHLDEVTQLRRDGRSFVVALTLSPILDTHGRFAGASVVARDVGARRTAEAALRASEAGLAASQRIAHLGSWVHHCASGQFHWSDELFRIAGHAPQSFVPDEARFLAAIHPDDRGQAERTLAAASSGAAPTPTEFRVVRPDGTERIVRQLIEVARDESGQITRLLGSVLDVTEQRALEGRLQHQALHDPLTQLPNRALFLERLDEAVARSRRSGLSCAVLFIDLDKFKTVNDTLGHRAGDRLLATVAERLRRSLRDEDVLARLGGDEFAALCEGLADATEAAQLAGRLSRALETQLVSDGQAHLASASIGIALSGPNLGRPEDLLRDADVAMYRAKRQGGARCALFDPAMQAQFEERQALERDLRGAFERGEFTIHYQPLVELATGRIVEAEALLRWRHPTRGNVAPDIFVPLAEESGLIGTLGRWILRQACRQARAWAEQGHPLTVAVNLTAREFQDPALTADVAHILAGAGLSPARLRLEITERLAMQDAPATAATLAALRELGVQVAIDDFGTGYSSLAYLKRFPVDVLKIDRAFVAGLGQSPEDTAIVVAMVGLGRALGLAVVAEGVETNDQAARLNALGCQLAQGFHYARPLEAGALGTLLATDAAATYHHLTARDPAAEPAI